MIPLGFSDWRREVARSTRSRVVNRYFEQTPDFEHGPVSHIARPGLKQFVEIGTGPIRANYSQTGSFDDDLFSVSGDFLYRVTTEGQTESLGAISTDSTSAVSMAATPRLGETPEYLFLTEGGVLWIYLGSGGSRGQLQFSDIAADSDTVTIGDVVYQYTSGDVDAGAPDGTVANPWLVAYAGDNVDDVATLFNAINDSGVNGTDYSTDLVVHPLVLASSFTTNDLFVTARANDNSGDTIVTQTTGANLSWGAATLVGGGTPQLRQVPTPDAVGIVWVAYLAGYVICVTSQGQGQNGRFYWVEPGETEIDPLNFATAERSPDQAWSVRVIGDQAWFLGPSSIEPWYLTGQDAAPFARQQSRVYDRGIWEGTDVQIRDTMLAVDSQDGRVYVIGGQGIQRVSNNSIEERVRRAMMAEVRGG